MKAPYWIEISSTVLVAGLSGRSTHCRREKSRPPVTRPIGGITTWSTSTLTMLLKAAPMITPTARSMTLPRAMNSRNSPMTVLRLVSGIFSVQPRAQLLAALEEGHMLGAHVNGIAGARITAGAGRTRADRKGAEAAQLDTAAAFQRVDDAVEDDAHHAFDVALRQVRIFRR